MFNDSTPPLLRGLGTTCVLIATVASIAVARQDPTPTSPAKPGPVVSAPDPDEDDSVVEEVLTSPWFEWPSLAGTGLIASSFYAEWHLRRRALRRAAK